MGLLHVSPPLVDRLVRTSAPDAVRPRLEMSHTLSCASKATTGSLACRYGPPELVVRLGRKPLVQVAPLLVEVAHPMLEEPPPKTRPTWNADTMVEPNWNVSGST